mmetsp:Transcript_6419/g.15581  ORF Transcript_6419/g.15581 Transcript_6419/m.15581 type:complete len:280 (+) Transcript_6419:126-965(+)
MPTMIANPILSAEGKALPFAFQPKTRKSNKCRFHNTVFVKEIPSIRTYSSLEKRMCWYNNDDYRGFRISLILERASVEFQQKTKTQVLKKNTSADQSPILPSRSFSPKRDQERDQTQRLLPLPFDDSDSDSDSDSDMDIEEDNEDQVLKAKAEKFRRLREQSKRQLQSDSHPTLRHTKEIETKRPALERTQYRFPPHHPLQAIHHNDPLNSRVRYTIRNPIKILPPSIMRPMKHEELEHLRLQSNTFYPGEALFGLSNGGSTNTVDILDSALSMVQETR